MAGHATGRPMGGHALAGKWLRRPMGALLALAPNPIDTRALATRALATAPESAGIGDMQGKATPGLGALGGGIAAAGQNAAAAKEKAEEDAAYEELRARQEQDRIDAEKQAKDEMEEALRAANHYWGILALSRNTSMLMVWMWAPPRRRSTPRWPMSSTSTRDSAR